MLIRILVVLGIVVQPFIGFAQINMNLVGQLTFPGHGDLSDVWGHVDTGGTEYAIVGLNNGTSIVNLSTPSTPNEVFFSGGANSIWRDLKVWSNHAYIVNESSGGMKIIDMSNLPAAITATDVYSFSGVTYPFTSAHDLYIDENGFAYIMGSDNGVGGAIILDLNNDPKVPVEVGRYNDYYLHDGMVRGDTLWGGAVNDGFFAAIDVSNKAVPVTLATQTTPSSFTHNCWISDDGHTLFTTDEKPNGFLAAYDVSNLANIQETDRVQSSPGQDVIPHNVFVKGDYLITSYYRDGVTIHDVSNPSVMVEVGNYDTSPIFSGNGFNGCWGVYPYFSSGLIIATDIENGLYVLNANYTHASYLQGNVTDSVSSSVLDAVQIDVVSTTISSNTNVLGDYIVGVASAGSYDVTFSKFGYETKTITGVVLSSGNTDTLDVKLKPIISFTLQGQVVSTTTLNPIANAKIKIEKTGFLTTLQTDAAGNFTVPNFIEGNYTINIGKWGFEQLCLTSEGFFTAGNTHIFQLENGYADDFIFDFGWTLSGAVSSGDWEKVTPVGTTFGSFTSNPGQDSQFDCGDEAYVTGNGGGSAGSDDIDGGRTVLTSPIFDLTSFSDPHIYFERWFYNGGGSTFPNDSLIIELSNGLTIKTIDAADVNDADLASWASKTIQVSSFLTPTNNMRLRITAMDVNGGHISEAAFDNFRVTSGLVSVASVNFKDEILIYPNPFITELHVSFKTNDYSKVRVDVLDVMGKVVEVKSFEKSSEIKLQANYPAGIYFIKIYGDEKLLDTQKVIKF